MGVLLSRWGDACTVNSFIVNYVCVVHYNLRHGGQDLKSVDWFQRISLPKFKSRLKAYQNKCSQNKADHTAWIFKTWNRCIESFREQHNMKETVANDTNYAKNKNWEFSNAENVYLYKLFAQKHQNPCQMYVHGSKFSSMRAWKLTCVSRSNV